MTGRSRILLGVMCVMVAIAALAVSPAAALARTYTKATISSSSYAPAYGAKVTLTAKLQTSSGTAIEGRTLKIQRWTGSEWVTIKSDTTSSKGKIYTTVLPYRSITTRYRARYGGSTKYYPSTSSNVTVKPRVYLTKPAGPDSWTVGSPFTVKGWLKPGHRVGTAAVVVYRFHSTSADGPWTCDDSSPGYAKATSTGSIYYEAQVMVPDDSHKYWRFMTYHAADAFNAATWSPDVIWMVND